MFVFMRKFTRRLNKLFSWLDEKINFKAGLQEKNLLTIHKRPLLSDSVNTWSDKLQYYPKFSIVIQGPLVTEQDFTLNTVRIYKKHFKNCQITKI